MTQPKNLLTPFDSFRSLFDRFFDASSAGHGELPVPFESSKLLAPINIAENDKNYLVTLEMPGVAADDIQVRMLGNRLTISGEKTFRNEVGGKDAAFHRVESSYGSFSRSVGLPDNVDPDKVDADYKNGVLTVTIPKAKAQAATRVQVKSKD
jgi:HSP20 family protein